MASGYKARTQQEVEQEPERARARPEQGADGGVGRSRRRRSRPGVRALQAVLDSSAPEMGLPALVKGGGGDGVRRSVGCSLGGRGRLPVAPRAQGGGRPGLAAAMEGDGRRA